MRAHYSLISIIVSGVIVCGIVVWAWTNPVDAPPLGYIPAPLNVSSSSQIKSGALGLGSMSTVTSSAILQLDAVNKGFLLPRMTQSQRDAIANPALGLLVYNTTANAVNRWNGIAWAEVGGIGWASNGSDLYNTNSGAVGIGTGTSTLSALLDVAGGVQIGNASTSCIATQAGTFRWTGSALEFCNGLAWKQLMGIKDGVAQTSPGDSCKQIKNDGYSTGSGLYWIDTTGGSTADAFQVYCDMTTDGGGWTIVYSSSGSTSDQKMVSNTAVNGNPLSFQHSNTTQAVKMAISAISTESLFKRSNGAWLKANIPLYNSLLSTANQHMDSVVNVMADNGASGSGYMGYSNYNIAGGGDYGIVSGANFDHHSASYWHLRSSCSPMFLYQYGGTYQVNTTLGTWTATQSCATGAAGLVFYAAMR